MAKRLSQEEKKEIIECFINGISINKLSERFDCTKLTISRNLKKLLGNEKYENILKELSHKKKDVGKLINNKNRNLDDLSNSFLVPKDSYNDYKKNNFNDETSFVEIAPLNININNDQQKDLSSIPLSSVLFPKLVYMIVDKNIELVIKYLKDFPQWQFLPDKDLKRKTIEIFSDLKNAKIACNKDQKVIKVPNTNVFKIVAPILLAKGISRIIKENQLIKI